MLHLLDECSIFHLHALEPREELISLHKHMVALFWGRFVTAVSEWLPRLWQLSYSWVAELPKSMNINTAIQIPCDTRALDSQTASPKKLSVATFVCSGGFCSFVWGFLLVVFTVFTSLYFGANIYNRNWLPLIQSSQRHWISATAFSFWGIDVFVLFNDGKWLVYLFPQYTINMGRCEMESKRNIISVFPLTKAIWQILLPESRQKKGK